MVLSSPVSSFLWLIASYLMEYTEDRTNEYTYLKPERFSLVLESSQVRAANRGLKRRDYDGQIANKA